jgi:CRISPR-associated endonuclease/helicase Cas3
VIVNTVQSAAVLTKYMADRSKQDVMHLSTALAPVDRNLLIQQIESRLNRESNWTLVATSLVEAGMNFSFATGFRQRCSAASLIQTGGRVNRSADKPDVGRVWDFEFSDVTMFPDNPYVRSSKNALGVLFDGGVISSDVAPDLARVCMEALRMEFKPRHQGLASEAIAAEMQLDYPSVAEKCRVIQGDTRLVIIDRQVVDRVRALHRFRVKVDHRELIMHSVQLYHTRIINLGLEQVIQGSEDLYALPEGWRYDPLCYGYMAGWFDLQTAKIPDGFFV